METNHGSIGFTLNAGYYQGEEIVVKRSSAVRAKGRKDGGWERHFRRGNRIREADVGRERRKKQELDEGLVRDHIATTKAHDILRYEKERATKKFMRDRRGLNESNAI